MDLTQALKIVSQLLEIIAEATGKDVAELIARLQKDPTIDGKASDREDAKLDEILPS